jgi:hypothetical protein
MSMCGIFEENQYITDSKRMPDVSRVYCCSRSKRMTTRTVKLVKKCWRTDWDGRKHTLGEED